MTRTPVFNARTTSMYTVLAMQEGVRVILYLYRCERASKGVEFADCLTEAMGAIMSRGKGNSEVTSGNPNGGKSQQWTTFVDIPMTGVTPSDLDDRYGTYDALEADVNELLNAGYRIAFSFNENNSAFICSVTCKASGDENEGCTYTAFAGDWYTALRVAMYKHYVIAQGVWRKSGGQTYPAFG